MGDLLSLPWGVPLGGEWSQNRGSHILNQAHPQPTTLAQAANPKTGLQERRNVQDSWMLVAHSLWVYDFDLV